LHKSGSEGEAAIAAFHRAAELQAAYDERAYFHCDLAGALFETDRHAEAAAAYARAIQLGDSGLVEALLADALLFAGRYADAEVQFDTYLKTDRGSADGEWRLKRSIIPLLRRFAGDVQNRDPARAEALVATVDLEDPSLKLEQALAVSREALQADVCNGEAWFRYMIVDPMSRGVEEVPPAPALAAAVLLRYGAGAWVWAAVAAELAGIDTLPDILQTAYRFERQTFVDAMVSGTLLEPGSEEWTRRMTMLEEAIARQQHLDQHGGFVMRFTDDEGGVDELVFGEP
jgi:tetratricopeptide (TPR) repeat protein